MGKNKRLKATRGSEKNKDLNEGIKQNGKIKKAGMTGHKHE